MSTLFSEESMNDNIKFIVNYFKEKSYPENFIRGLLRNFRTETANSFNPKQVQLSALKKYGITNEDYVSRVDLNIWSIVKDNTVRDFTTDGIGFGLAQWTSVGRKTRYLAYCKERGKSIGDLETQCAFIDEEIHSTGYATCRKAIKDNWSVEECVRIICEEYERPASMQTDKKEEAIQNRMRPIEDEDSYFREVKPMAKRICLDAGHYGRYNRSTVISTYWESDFTWAFTNFEAEALRKKGFEVVLTRDDKNKDLDLTKRGKMAKGCDLFISNHSNACGTESVDRPVVIYPVGYNDIDVERNRVLATLIADNIARTMGTKDKGKVYSKPAGYDRNKNGHEDDEYYGVMHGAQSVKCPLYMIVEHSFHTNRNATKWLLNTANVKKLAEAEANVIATFLGCEEVQTPDVTTPTVEYIVKKGDNLTKIADNFNTTVEEIMVLNPSITNPNKIYIGQKLIIPTFLTEKVDDVNYIVVKNDTLSKIAKKYNTTYLKLMLINGLTTTTIYPGQVIKLK